MRKAEIKRKTNETDISLALNIDGTGNSVINTGCGFLDHMLTLLAAHAGFDLNIKCCGDVNVDYHHTVEDIGIALGDAFCISLGDRSGILRYGDATIPMDEALVLTAVDISGRSSLNFNLDIPTEKVGDFDTELAEEFWLGFTRHAKITMHFLQFAGKNSHHIIECAFKSAAHSLKKAVSINNDQPDKIPSTKGVL